MVRVDMGRDTIEIMPFPVEWQLLGGRALTARILCETVDPQCDPLGPNNKLIIAPGLLTGTAAATSGRLSFGAKSPLTRGIKESNSGGNAGQHLARMGIRALVIEGAPADAGTCHGLVVDSTGIRLVAADEFAGSWNYDTCRRLAERFPAKASFIVCGPAGEQGLAAASIACTDRDNRYPTRHAARGGLGAVMGSKQLKFIVIDPGKAFSAARVPKRKTGFKECLKRQTKRYLDGPQRMAKGTARAVAKAASLNTLPYKNRRAGRPPAEDVVGLDGATILASFAERGGGMHNCMSGCIVNCSNLVNREDGSYLTSALELETLGLLGSNCAVGKWDEVGELDRLCDDIGLDTMETGVAIGVLMDAGRMAWGDVAAMTELLHQVAAGSELGRVVGNGARSVGEFTGHGRVPVVKGQGLPVWDPRVMKATGVTYATSAMGADHTAGIVTLVGLPHDNLAALSQEAQILNAIGDSAGYCQFIGATIRELRPLLEALFDRTIADRELIEVGWQCLQAEWDFNRRAGFTESDDDLPACMKAEPVGEWAYVFDVDATILQQVKRSLLPVAEDFCDKPFF
jgi:aldehyde:ferredoxin oxidoreductase